MPNTHWRLVVIDDELAIRRFLRTALGAQGHTVFEAADGQSGLAAVAQHHPDLILLDIGLPDMSGIEVTRRLREWSELPIIILSVRGSEDDKIAALDAGADDYLTKPFGVGELEARMRAALRRAVSPMAEPSFRTAALHLDFATREVWVAHQPIALTPTEYDIVRLLATHAGKVLTHGQLLRQVWGMGYEQDFHLLRVNISNLRRKLEPDPTRPTYIITEPGVGYRLRLLPPLE